MFKSRDCEPDTPRKCKPPPVKKEKVECIEPEPPGWEDKEYFSLDSPDPFVVERAKCLENCHVKPIFETLKECSKRVTRKIMYTAENCHPETIDLMEALDKCTGDKGFKKLA